MARLNAANNAEATLIQTAGIADTTFTVDDASVFPTAPFRLSIDDEIVEVVAVSGNSLTVERGKENTNPAAHNVGAKVESRFTAGMHNELVSQEELGEVDTRLTSHLADYAQFRNNIEQELNGTRVDLINSVNNLIEM